MAWGDLRRDAAAARRGAPGPGRDRRPGGGEPVDLRRSRPAGRPAGGGLPSPRHRQGRQGGGPAPEHRRVLRGDLRPVPDRRAARLRAARPPRDRDRLLLRVHRGGRLRHRGRARRLRLPGARGQDPHPRAHAEARVRRPGRPGRLRGAGRGGRGAGRLRRAPPGRPGLPPALRRQHRRTEADPAHPRRLHLLAPGLQRDLRGRREQRLPVRAARRPQLPALLPGSLGMLYAGARVVLCPQPSPRWPSRSSRARA